MGLATGSDEVTVMRLVTSGDAVTAVRLVTRGEEIAAVRLATGGDAVTAVRLVTDGGVATAMGLVTRGEEVAAVRLATGGDDVTAVRLVTGGLAEIRSTTAPRKQTSCTRHCGCCAPHVSGGNDEDGDWVTRNMLLCLTGFKGHAPTYLQYTARSTVHTIYR